jgi:hypothetical protein
VKTCPEYTHKPELAQADPDGLYQKLFAAVQAVQERQFCGEEPVQDMMKPELQTHVTTMDVTWLCLKRCVSGAEGRGKACAKGFALTRVSLYRPVSIGR